MSTLNKAGMAAGRAAALPDVPADLVRWWGGTSSLVRSLIASREPFDEPAIVRIRDAAYLFLDALGAPSIIHQSPSQNGSAGKV